MRVVLDANNVHDELSFRLRRQSPIARTDLYEMIDAGVVEAFIPRFLDDEISEHAQEIGERFGKSAEEVRAAYLEFRSRLRCLRRAGSGRSVAARIDPDDVLYKRVFEELGADAVLTQDKHFRKMNVPSVGRLPRALRDYARSSSVYIGITSELGLVLVLGFGSLTGACAVVDRLLSAIGRLPDWAKFLLAVSVAALIVHPTSRKKLMEQWTRFREWMISLAPTLGTILREIAVAYVKANDHAKTTASELQQILPETRPKTTIQLIRLILLMSDAPISVADIAAQMRGEGFGDEDENLSRDIEEELRASLQFIEASKGKWMLRDRAAEHAASLAPRPAEPTRGPALPLGSFDWFTPPPLISTGITWAALPAQVSASVSIPIYSTNGAPASARRRKRAPVRRRARVSKAPTLA